MQFGDVQPEGCGSFQMEWPTCYPAVFRLLILFSVSMLLAETARGVIFRVKNCRPPPVDEDNETKIKSIS